ncbi:glycoside hydrolase family 88 protein [uncultured Enterococcus sp.]|uniref:glycoside hydrolase family 88/105 protein n=1 Tax=uncultured Enterococcus sp. TaxID=167972 RepID=UPI002AA7144B|nr:glycoside hydrolase family 88 protein [uncultured Enterococcus sp.]
MEQIKLFFDEILKNTTPERPPWNKEVTLGSSPKWSYIDGCMTMAMLKMYEATGDQAYLNFLDTFIDHYIDEEGNILGFDIAEHNCDNINEGKVLYPLLKATSKEKYEKALRNLYAQLLEQPRTPNGNFWHKEIYPNQIWLDGLYMVQPFYVQYDILFNQGKNQSDIFRQFQNAYQLMRDPKTGLLYHGVDETKTAFWANSDTGCSQNFWTRSHGWYAMALVDTIEFFDETHQEEKRMLIEQLKELLDTLLNFANPKTMMFYQVTDQGAREGNYLETSGTCAIAYALMKGTRLGYLPEPYFEKGAEILQAVVKHKLMKIDGEYVLKDICLVAGLGGMPGHGSYKVRDGSYEYYISEPIVTNDAKGIAPLVFAYAELIQHKE